MTDVLEPVADGDGVGEPGRRRARLAPVIVAVVAVVVAGLLLVLLGAGGTQQDTADTPLLNRAAPGVVGELADGTPFDLSRRKGSWVVLNFFTSTCVPCQQEHPELIRFDEQQAGIDDGAELYSVVVDDDVESVEAFFADNGGSWPQVYDPDGRFAVAFGVAKVPETWIIDPDGIVRGRIISQVTADLLGTEIQQLRELRAGAS